MTNDSFGADLRRLLAEYGHDLPADSRRLQGLLRDLFPGQRREVNLLLTAARNGIPQRLADPPQGLPPEVLQAQLTNQLEADEGTAPEAARWAVETWAVAVGSRATLANDKPQSTAQFGTWESIPTWAKAAVWLALPSGAKVLWMADAMLRKSKLRRKLNNRFTEWHREIATGRPAPNDNEQDSA